MDRYIDASGVISSALYEAITRHDGRGNDAHLSSERQDKARRCMRVKINEDAADKDEMRNCRTGQ